MQKQSYIDRFVEEYRKNAASYELVCDRARQIVDSIVKERAIMAIVTGRVKSPGRLREKLQRLERELGRPFESLEEIHGTITDLVGVRVALYFPNEVGKIGALLTPYFRVRTEKDFPVPVDGYEELVRDGFTAHKRRIYPGYEGRRFDGYRARHFRVEFLEPPTDSIPNPGVEIQVASVLMHAWSEVEHDLAYKKKKGQVSREEYECLDEINGLVMAGEIALNRLDRLFQQRQNREDSEFESHYALSDYLAEAAREFGTGADGDPGNVQTLFRLYSEKNTLTRSFVDGELRKLKKQQYGREEPLANRLIEQFAADRNQNLVKKVLSDAVMEFNDLDPETYNHAMLGKFMGKWNQLEKTVMATLRRMGYRAYNSAGTWHFIMEEDVLTPAIREEYHRLRLERNKIIHGYRAPEPGEFQRLNAAIDALAAAIKAEYGE